jgi:tRNA modification GTPase
MTLFVGNQEQTIIAQCTPQGSGALALVRLSGAQSWTIAEQLSRLSHNKKITEQSSHTVHHGFILKPDDTDLDEVMFIIMRGPKTFTGEDVVEITCHNNPLIIQQLIDHACFLGARIAEPGEFSRRAVMNDKIDLTQAEAIYDLIHAQTEQSLKRSLAQVKGSLSQISHTIEAELVSLLAWCEASFEFLDEGGDFADELRTRLNTLMTMLHDIQRGFNTENLIRQGMRVALIGSVNAGKSSLFNSLVGQKRAIVTPIAGTTRDSIEATITRDGVTFTIIDTAGLRTTDDIIEQEGIDRSLHEAALADVVLIVIDQSRIMNEAEQEIYTKLCDEHKAKSIIILNKCDLPQQIFFKTDDAVQISTVTKNGIKELEELLVQHYNDAVEQHNSPYLLTQRQRIVIDGVAQKLKLIQTLLNDSHISYEIVSYHLRDVLEQLTELTGKSVTEAGLNQVFKQFCIGK